MEFADAAAGELCANDVRVVGQLEDDVRIEVETCCDGGEVVDEIWEGGVSGDLEWC